MSDETQKAIHNWNYNSLCMVNAREARVGEHQRNDYDLW